MRRLSLIMLVILLMANLIGCNGDKSNDSSQSQVSRQQISAGSSNETQSSSAKSTEQGAEVIVKSKNQSSSQEKEMVLDEINKEMDSMIDGINAVEDVSDEDLNI